MNHHHIRRASLGLAIRGPFSRNRRRRRHIAESVPWLITIAVATAFIGFTACLFTL